MTDAQALEALSLLTRLEGILPALESAHAIYYAVELARELGPDGIIVVNLSGRGDKDVSEVMRLLDLEKKLDSDKSGAQPQDQHVGDARKIEVNA